MKISIVLADDHPAILEGIQAYFNKDDRFQISGTVNNGSDLLDSMAIHKADVILLDLNMPGIDGLVALEKLNNMAPKVKVIIMTNYNSPELVKDCKSKGASGYVIKSDKLEPLASIILNVLNGIPHFPSLQAFQSDPIGFSYFDDFLKKHKLTKREVEIIRLVCQNRRTREIAERLYLSEFTVHTHRRNIMRKLEIGDSTVALYNFAIKNNLIVN